MHVRFWVMYIYTEHYSHLFFRFPFCHWEALTPLGAVGCRVWPLGTFHVYSVGLRSREFGDRVNNLGIFACLVLYVVGCDALGGLIPVPFCSGQHCLFSAVWAELAFLWNRLGQVGWPLLFAVEDRAWVPMILSPAFLYITNDQCYSSHWVAVLMLSVNIPIKAQLQLATLWQPYTNNIY